MTKEPLKPDSKRLVREVIGWKWLRHENILPFVGVMLTPPFISIISDRMQHGNIMEFVKACPNFNRLDLVSGRRRSLFLRRIDLIMDS